MSAPAAASLDPRERRMLERLVGLLKAEFGDHLHAVWLFGSRARGEESDEESDVDLLIVTSGGEDDHERITELVFEAAAAAGCSPVFFSAHVYDPERLASRRAIDSFFIQEVDRDKIVLFGEP